MYLCIVIKNQYMEKIIFVSNVNDISKLNKLKSYVENVEACFTSNFKSVIESNKIVITEEIVVDSKYGYLTPENIESIKNKFKGVKLVDNDREVNLEYNYNLYINQKSVYNTSETCNGVLTNKKTGKSKVYFENYVINTENWKMMSLLSEIEKERMTKQNKSLQKIFAHYVCYSNNIDIIKLENFTLNKLLKQEKSSYNTTNEFFMLYDNNKLTVCVKEFFQTRGWGDWLYSGTKTTNINLSTINSEISEYEKIVEFETKKLEEQKKEEQEMRIKEEQKIEEERKKEKSYHYNYQSNYHSNFDEAEYDKRGRAGGGWSDDIPGFTNDEVESYRDRVYERDNGRGRYDM